MVGGGNGASGGDGGSSKDEEEEGMEVVEEKAGKVMEVARLAIKNTELVELVGGEGKDGLGDGAVLTTIEGEEASVDGADEGELILELALLLEGAKIHKIDDDLLTGRECTIEDRVEPTQVELVRGGGGDGMTKLGVGELAKGASNWVKGNGAKGI